jgi:hypothetical protein
MQPAPADPHSVIAAIVHRALWRAAAVYVVVVGVEVGLILLLNGGVFTFSLDDPYIHLSLAENIAIGQYGLNVQEAAAPASSILWPLLLVPFARTSLAVLWVLLLNVASWIGVLAVAARLYAEVVAEHVETAGRERAVESWAFVSLIGLAVIGNAVGLALTGMEHSLHTFASALTVYGLVRERRTGQVPWGLLAAIVAGPLVRYEGLALSVPALAYLVWRGHVRRAAGTGIALATLLVGFSLFLVSIGQHWLPNSVLIKSDVMSGLGRLGVLLSTVRTNLGGPQGWFLATAAVLTVLLVVPKTMRSYRPLAAWVAAAVALHLLVGRFGWYDRYEIYISVSAMLVLLYVGAARVSQLSDRRALAVHGLIGAALLAAGAWLYAPTMKTTPMAANNIAQQQYEMWRFATQYYGAPVAVNDVGIVTYRNDHYVLDLYGLASRETFDSKSAKEGGWMDRHARAHDVRLAMIYEDWFTNIPKSWIPVMDMALGGPRVTAGGSVVTFYALDEETARRVDELMPEFEASLPPNCLVVRRTPAAPAH